MFEAEVARSEEAAAERGRQRWGSRERGSVRHREAMYRRGKECYLQQGFVIRADSIAVVDEFMLNKLLAEFLQPDALILGSHFAEGVQ